MIDLMMIFLFLGAGYWAYVVFYNLLGWKGWSTTNMKLLDFIEELVRLFSNYSNGYELSEDVNYIFEVENLMKTIIGNERYMKLCYICQYSSAITFCDKHKGIPSVNITIPIVDDNEELQFGTLIQKQTELYLANYNVDEILSKISWTKNLTLGYPMLIIYYARNNNEIEMLRRIITNDFKAIIASTSNDVMDDEVEIW